MLGTINKLLVINFLVFVFLIHYIDISTYLYTKDLFLLFRKIKGEKFAI